MLVQSIQQPVVVGTISMSKTACYVQMNGKEVGPISGSVLKQFANQGKISPETLVRIGSSGKWIKARKIKKLAVQFTDHLDSQIDEICQQEILHAKQLDTSAVSGNKNLKNKNRDRKNRDRKKTTNIVFILIIWIAPFLLSYLDKTNTFDKVELLYVGFTPLIGYCYFGFTALLDPSKQDIDSEKGEWDQIITWVSTGIYSVWLFVNFMINGT